MKIFGYNHIHDENNNPNREPLDGGTTAAPDGTDGKKTKMPSPKDTVTLFAVFILFCISGISPMPFSLFFAVAAAPLYAALSGKMGNRFLIFPPVAAFIASLIVTRSAAGSVEVLLASGMAFALLCAVCKNPENAKTSAVIGSTVVCLLCAALFLLLFMLENGIEANQLKESFDLIFGKEYFTEIYGNIDFSAFGIEFSESELAAAAELAAFQAKTLFPAICVIWCLFISYISASLLKPAAKLLKNENMLMSDKVLYEIRLSPFAIVVYFVSSLGMMLFGGNAAYGLRNVTYILAPGFMLCGMKQIRAYLKEKGIPSMAILVIQLAAVSLSVMFGNLGVTLLIILGMFYTTKINPSKNK